jgi:hypothetical protein
MRRTRCSTRFQALASSRKNFTVRNRWVCAEAACPRRTFVQDPVAPRRGPGAQPGVISSRVHAWGSQRDRREHAVDAFGSGVDVGVVVGAAGQQQ